MATCKYCGAAGEGRFCTKCGFSLTVRPTTPASNGRIKAWVGVNYFFLVNLTLWAFGIFPYRNGPLPRLWNAWAGHNAASAPDYPKFTFQEVPERNDETSLAITGWHIDVTLTSAEPVVVQSYSLNHRNGACESDRQRSKTECQCYGSHLEKFAP